MLGALNFISSLPPSSKISIFTDSMSLAKAVNSSNLSSSLQLQIYKTLTILSTLDYKIHVECVKAHANTYGNEIADSLAKTGALSGVITFSKTPSLTFINFSTTKVLTTLFYFITILLIEKGY